MAINNYNHPQYLKFGKHEVAESPIVISKTFNAETDLVFTFAEFDPGHNASIVALDSELNFTLTGTHPKPENNPDTCADDNTVGSEAWQNPTNAQEATSDKATITGAAQPDGYADACADDNTVGSETWQDPTNAQGNDANYASIIDAHPGGFTGTAADDATVGTIAWTNITNAEGDTSGTFAGATLSLNEISHYAECTNFGFTIPTGATILGIKVESKAISGGGGIEDSSVKLVKAGTIQGDDNAAAGVWAGAQEWGGTTDMWGLTFTPAEINASNFGVAISATQLVDTSGSANLYTVKITVYYSDAEGHYLECTTYGFALDSDATILGVRIDATTTGSTSEIEDSSIKLVKAGTIQGDDKAIATAWDGGSRSWGGATDMWGLTFTPAEINASDFGVAISPTWDSNTGASEPEARLLAIKTTVYYELEGHYLKSTGFGFSIPTNATVTGVLVTANTSTSTVNIEDFSVKLVKGDTIQGNDNAVATDWTDSGSIRSWGGSSDMWGLALSPADVNAADFGVAIAAKEVDSTTQALSAIQEVTITLSYTFPLIRKWEINPQGIAWETLDSETLTCTAGDSLPSNVLYEAIKSSGFTNAVVPLTLRLSFTVTGGTTTLNISMTDTQGFMRSVGVIS